MRSSHLVLGAVSTLAFVFSCSLVIDTDKLRGGAADDLDSGIVSDSSIDGDSAVRTDSTTQTDSIVTPTDADGGGVDSVVDTLGPDTVGPPPVIGKLYMISGNVEGKQAKDVVVADLRDDGTLSSWTDGPMVPAAAAANGLTIVGNTVYVIGVDSNRDSNETVRFAKLDKGILGDWALDGSFPRTLRAKLGAAGIPGFVFGIGGADTDGVGVKEVLFSALKSDGSPDTWNATTPLPAERFNFASAQWKEHVWVMGGGDVTGKPQNSIYHARLTTTGIASWDTLTALSFTPFGTDAVVAGNFLYLLGGYGSAFKVVWYAPIAADGTLGAWLKSTKSMVFEHAELRAVAIGTRFLCAIGGADSKLADTANAECAPLSGTGSVGDWKAVTPLPKTRVFHTGFGVTL